MTFEPTLIIFLFLYLAFIGIFFLFTVIHIYHIFLNASFTFLSFIVTAIFCIMTISTVLITIYLLKDINWRQPILNQSRTIPSFSSF